MGKIGKGQSCNLCLKPAVRSLPMKDAISIFSEAKKLKAEGRRIYVCKEHYKEYKKKVKESRKVELWRIKQYP
ncbi:MAG: hypothetical protein QXK12_04670 [Candidatus Nezhaarchaeales archaeon]